MQDYAFLQPGIGLIAYISLTLLSILTLIHMNVEELWERFTPSARRCGRMKTCRFASAAIIPAIAIRAAAAVTATLPCATDAARACKRAGLR